MKKIVLENIFACPQCKTPITIKNKRGTCKKCKFAYKKSEEIWDFLYLQNPTTKTSAKKYDSLHKKPFGGPTDGSYEILASIARGNRTVDIACGEGLIEKLSPETVGVEFSLNALKKAQKNGAKHLILADAHALPFQKDCFDLALSTGNIEHFENPKLAIEEMARVAKMQLFIVHTYPTFPFARLLHQVFTFFLKLKHQPIEKPLNPGKLEKMVRHAGLSIVYKGVWTLPFNYGRPFIWLPVISSIPVCSFIISIKK